MRVNIGVFFGGYSVEHEISILSAMQTIYALNKNKYKVIPIYIGKDCNFYTGKELLNIQNYNDMDKLLPACKKVAIVRNDDKIVGYRNPPKLFGNNVLFGIDVALPIVHGTNCEDGTIQGYFELLGIPYVGSNVLASSIGGDKVVTKEVLRGNGIKVLDYISFSFKEWFSNIEIIIHDIEERLGYPLIIKPANLGSSIGVKKASNRKELEKAVDLAKSFSTRIIVERAIVNLREINCSVLGDTDKAYPSVCEEPISSDEILSYKDKYLSKGSSKGISSAQRRLPADIPSILEKRIKDIALKVFKVVGCSGVVRIDFLIDIEQNNEIYVNELNTIPGSLAFYLWEATDKSFCDLLDDLIKIALKRHRENKSLLYTINTNIFSNKGVKGLKGFVG